MLIFRPFAYGHKYNTPLRYLEHVCLRLHLVWICTHCFVYPDDVGAVREGLVGPKVGDGLGLHPRALLALQHARTSRAVQRVDLEDGRTKGRHRHSIKTQENHACRKALCAISDTVAVYS